MNLPFLQLVLTATLVRIGFSTPVGSDITSLSDFDFSDRNVNLPIITSLTPNASESLNGSLTSRTWLPHLYRVPGTNTVLYLGFGIIRRRLDLAEIKTTLLLANDTVSQGIRRFGRNTFYPITNANRQYFSDYGFGMQLNIANDRKHAEHFTWQDLYNTVDGLYRYLFEAGRNYETAFLFYSGPVERPEIYTYPKGHGRLWRVPRRGAVVDE